MDTPVSIGVTIALVLAPQPCTHPAAISSSQAGGRLHRLMCPSTASLVPGQRIVQAWRFAAGRPINSLIHAHPAPPPHCTRLSWPLSELARLDGNHGRLRLSCDAWQGFNVRQVRDRLAMSAGAGRALATPVASQEKTV